MDEVDPAKACGASWRSHEVQHKCRGHVRKTDACRCPCGSELPAARRAKADDDANRDAHQKGGDRHAS